MNAGNAKILVFCAVLGLLAALPAAAAHAAPPPPEYEIRLLHDCNDDYFQGDATGNKNGHDVIALDIRERYDAQFGVDVVAFRLIMNGGYGGDGTPTLRDDVSFKVGTAAKKHSFTTTNNQAFAGSFDRIEGPHPVLTTGGSPDGERFSVVGILKHATIGASVGSKLSEFKVESFIDGTRGDFMPGTYDTSVGPAPTATACDPNRSDQTTYQRPDYTVRGPAMYATMRVNPAQATLALNSERLISLEITNSLRNTAQTFTLRGQGGDGVEWSFHNPTSNTYESELQGDLAAGAQTLVHLAVTGIQDKASGTISITLSTDLGGRVTGAFTYTVAAASGGTPTSPSPTGNGTASDGEAPGPSMLILLAGVAVAFWVRRP